MSDAELAWTPAWRLREMFVGKQLSPLEFAQFLLARVERLEDLGAFITVFPDRLLSEARTATGAVGLAGATTHGKLNRRPLAVEARK